MVEGSRRPRSLGPRTSDLGIRDKGKSGRVVEWDGWVKWDEEGDAKEGWTSMKEVG